MCWCGVFFKLFLWRGVLGQKYMSRDRFWYILLFCSHCLLFFVSCLFQTSPFSSKHLWLCAHFSLFTNCILNLVVGSTVKASNKVLAIFWGRQTWAGCQGKCAVGVSNGQLPQLWCQRERWWRGCLSWMWRFSSVEEGWIWGCEFTAEGWIQRLKANSRK